MAEPACLIYRKWKTEELVQHWPCYLFIFFAYPNSPLTNLHFARRHSRVKNDRLKERDYVIIVQKHSMWFIKIRNFMNAMFMFSQLWYTKTCQLFMSSGFLCKATRLHPNPSCRSSNSYLSALYHSTASHYMSRHTLLLHTHRLFDRAVCFLLNSCCCVFVFCLFSLFIISNMNSWSFSRQMYVNS